MVLDEEIRFPKALRPNDEVAVVAPASGGVSPDALERGLERLRSWGLRPVLMPHATRDLDWPEGCSLAAVDEHRLSDLQTALADPRYRAVFCTRGGYGTARLLEWLDFATLARDPKPIVGYSDLTALLLASLGQVGIVSFHGPMVGTRESMDPGADGWALQQRLLTVDDGVPDLAVGSGGYVLHAGFAEGRLVGGNLSIIQSLMGTPWQMDFTGRLVFLEEIGESPYRIDRMLTQLLQAGLLRRAAGVLLGDFHEDGTDLASEYEPIRSVVEERLRVARIPVVAGLPFGHRPGSWTLPVGVRARLEAPAFGAPVLRLLEPAVCR